MKIKIKRYFRQNIYYIHADGQLTLAELTEHTENLYISHWETSHRSV